MQRLPLFALGLLVASPVLGADWYVSPAGSDAATGSSPALSPDGKAGPFATLQRAREAVRQSRAAGLKEAQTVHVRAGHYYLTEAFTLGAADSGEPGAPVVWKAFEGEDAVLSGAAPLEGWSLWKGGIYKAPLGKWAKIKGGIRQLLLDGERQTLARYPNADPSQPASGGWAFADGKSWPMYADIPGEDKRSLEVLPGDLRVWAKPAQVEIVVFPRYNWWNSRARVGEVDPTNRKVTLTSDCSYAIRKGDRYFFQNALEELDSPGEWVADAEEGMLYFWPPAGKKPSDATVVVSQSLVRMEQGAHDLAWRGFTMEGCDGTAVILADVQRCSVEGNRIRGVGEWNGSGVSVSKGKSNRVAYNTISHVGNSGISLTGGDVATLTPSEHVAEHNHIHDVGIYYKQGVGISLSGVGNRALHNEIHEGPRFGVMHSGNRNEIGWNHIYNVSLETEDTGAIYSGGRDWITPRGTSIYYNYIHDVPGFSMHDGKVVSPNFAWGIYLDDNSGGVDVYGNIVARCGRGGMHAHGARDCVVTNNIFVGSKDWQVDFHGWTVQQGFWERHLPTMAKGFESVVGQPAWKGMRGMDIHPAEVPLADGLTMRGNVFTNNILVSDKPETPVMSILRVPFNHNAFDHNLYWAPEGKIRTGFHSAGEDQGQDLLPPFEGEPEGFPRGWRWSTKPALSPMAAFRKTPEGSGFFLSGEATPEVKGSLVVSGADLQLEPGASYRLRARMRASAPGRAGFGMQSYVTKVFFWISPRSEIDVSTEWADKEWVFEVPSPGKPGWHEQMKSFSPRISWKITGATLEVAEMHLHKVTPDSEWDAWRKNGVDGHSLVADPGWEDADKFTLKKDSPAWQLGFARIPVEQIGPQGSAK